MKLENIVKTGIFSALMAAASNAPAQEANQEATPQESLAIYQKNDNATNASKDEQKDWSQQKKLIDEGHATVLIQPVKDKPDYCVVGLDGFPQRYEPPADKRTDDMILEKCRKPRGKKNETPHYTISIFFKSPTVSSEHHSRV